jgi:lipopolysaccharide transport system permease protein
MMLNVIRNMTAGAKDIVAGLCRYGQVGVLGWQDVRQRYRRSALGPFWLTISMAILIGTIGLVFSQIYRVSIREFLPYLACGMILWGFISSTVSEACQSFIGAEAIIKQLPIPLFVHVLRVIWRNVIILGHNFVIFPVVLIFFSLEININTFFVIPGFLLLLLNLAWLSLIIGIVCARYRDLPQIINSALQILIFLTPIMWMPNSIAERVGFYLVQLNPLYHLLDLVRAPLLGQSPALTSWAVVILMGIIGWLSALYMYARYKNRIVFWL